MFIRKQRFHRKDAKFAKKFTLTETTRFPLKFSFLAHANGLAAAFQS